MDHDLNNDKESLALVFDASSSAAPVMAEIWNTSKSIENILGVEELKLFALGNGASLPLSTLTQAKLPGAANQRRPCSLIAPIMETMIRGETRFSVVVVGNGEIFDLDDWVDEPLLDGILLVRAGSNSLKKETTDINEISLEELESEGDHLRELFSRPDRVVDESTKVSPKQSEYKWRVDRTGYPLVSVRDSGLYVGLFPVSNSQFEKFIVERRHSEFDDEWYDQILSLRERGSYRVEDDELTHLFMSGVTTKEALSFCRWLGQDYRLLTAAEWSACHSSFESQPLPSLTAGLSALLSRDARQIWNRVDQEKFNHHKDLKLQNLSLMSQGILEWVSEMPGTYHGIGDPVAARSLRNVYDPVTPLGPEPRLANLGFRVCTK